MQYQYQYQFQYQLIKGLNQPSLLELFLTSYYQPTIR